MITPDIPARARVFHENLPAGFGAATSALSRQVLTESPGPSAARLLELGAAQSPEFDAAATERALAGARDRPDAGSLAGLRLTRDLEARLAGERALAGEGRNPVLTAEEANARYELPGLRFDEPVSSRVAEIKHRRKMAELKRLDTIRRGPSGVLSGAASFAVALAASALDPLNVASAFLPVIGQAKYGAMIARMGRVRAAAVRGAVEGTAGAAVVEPLVLAAASTEEADYGAVESLINVAFGGLFGAGLHTATGAAARLVARLQPGTREAAMRTAVAQMAQGRAVEVGPVLRADPDFVRVMADPRERLLSETAVGQVISEAPPWRVEVFERSARRGVPVDVFERELRAARPEIFIRLDEVEARRGALVERNTEAERKIEGLKQALVEREVLEARAGERLDRRQKRGLDQRRQRLAARVKELGAKGPNEISQAVANLRRGLAARRAEIAGLDREGRTLARRAAQIRARGGEVDTAPRVVTETDARIAPFENQFAPRREIDDFARREMADNPELDPLADFAAADAGAADLAARGARGEDELAALRAEVAEIEAAVRADLEIAGGAADAPDEAATARGFGKAARQAAACWARGAA